MSADRCYVGAVVPARALGPALAHGVPQFYQRDREEKRGDKFVAVPFFVVNTNEAATMSEGAAKSFVARLQSLGVNNVT
jgi:hypothetical protein